MSKEGSPVTVKRKMRRGLAAAVATLALAGGAACATNDGGIEPPPKGSLETSSIGEGPTPTAIPPFVRPSRRPLPPGATGAPETRPTAKPTPKKIETKPTSACDTEQTSDHPIEGNNGDVDVAASVQHPTVAVALNPEDTSNIVKFKGSNGKWNTVGLDQPDAATIIRLTGDSLFDTNNNRDVWARTCKRSPFAADKEVESRIANAKDNGATVVVVYTVGPDGTIQQRIER